MSETEPSAPLPEDVGRRMAEWFEAPESFREGFERGYTAALAAATERAARVARQVAKVREVADRLSTRWTALNTPKRYPMGLAARGMLDDALADLCAALDSVGATEGESAEYAAMRQASKEAVADMMIRAGDASPAAAEPERLAIEESTADGIVWQRSVTGWREKPCADCGGTGDAPSAVGVVTDCSTCDGSGLTPAVPTRADEGDPS